MPFTASDSYTPIGATKIYDSWTDKVTKYDSSSFYNWEQDNEPVYDLDERSYYLWEQLGFPTSACPGIAFCVSSNITQAQKNANNNFFSSVSSAVKALPQTLNFPTLIEVGSFGQIGTMNIDNLKINKGGSLEIVNRVFSKIYSVSSAVSSVLAINNNDYVYQVYAPDASGTLYNSSCVAASAQIFSSLTDTRLDAAYAKNIILSPVGSVYPQISTWGLGATVSIYGANPYILQLTPYEYVVPESTVSSHDVSAYDPINATNPVRSAPVASQKVTGVVIGNTLETLQLENCDGPIYLRNFLVGTNFLVYDYGIKISNCTDVVLENCFAFRGKKAGILIENSNVTIRRGTGAYRCYELNGALTNRVGEEVPGMKIVNSTVNIEGTSSTINFASGSDNFYNFSRNQIGIDIINSVVSAGVPRSELATAGSQSYLQLEYNTLAGLRATNSKVIVNGRIDAYGNKTGIILDNSILEVDEVTLQDNDKEGIIANNSKIIYNRNKRQVTTADTYVGQILSYGNAQHMVLNNSIMEPAAVSSNYPGNTGQMVFIDSYGVASGDTANRSIIPSVELKGHSYMRLVHPKFVRGSNYVVATNACYGTLLAVRENSTAILQGSNDFASLWFGPPDFDKQKKQALLYAKDGSIIEVNGPTLIAQGHVDILAEDSSIININPHKNKNTGDYDVSGFNLTDTANHTSVELHATKACLVANRGSQINMSDLGAYSKCWASGTNGPTILGENPDYTLTNVSSVIRGGSIQFYPNPDDTVTQASGNNNIESYFGPTQNTFDTVALDTAYNQALRDPTAGESTLDVSLGGFCVRALQGSKVNVRNVHFLGGYPNASGAIYEASGNDCDYLYIWNIANDSSLKAAYCSVSAHYPLDTGYHGPSSIWTSGGVAYYGAPSSTPDTSTLSVLDTFGLSAGNVWPLPGGSLTRYGQTSWLNSGPFRLYMGVKSSAYSLATSSGVYGATQQLFAQGYNASANLSAVGSTSGLHWDLLKVSGNTLMTSGFYYCSAFVDQSFDRVLLDESAADTFANAKNGAAGTSGRPKICSIFHSNQLAGGDANANSQIGHGKGFKSVNDFDLDREL